MITRITDSDGAIEAELDSQGRRWHVLERLDGSISVYYTVQGAGCVFVVWDSLNTVEGGEQDKAWQPVEWHKRQWEL